MGCECPLEEAGAGEERRLRRHRVVEGEEEEAEEVGRHRHPSSVAAAVVEAEVGHHQGQAAAFVVFCQSPVLEEPPILLASHLQT